MPPVMDSLDASRSPIPEGPYDLIVAGGGALGTAILRDAVFRGRSTVLFEKEDIGSGASGSSAGLLRAGLRLVPLSETALVVEALRERDVLRRIAPHLARSQPVAVPIHQGGQGESRATRAALFLERILAGTRPRTTRLPRYLAKEEALARIEGLRGEKLLGAGLYEDLAIDGARLSLLHATSALEEARRTGITCAVRTYTRVVDWRPTSPVRVTVEDSLSARAYVVYTHRFVQALGAWSPEGTFEARKVVGLLVSPPAARVGLVLEDPHVRLVAVPRGPETLVEADLGVTSSALEDLRVEQADVRSLSETLARYLDAPGTAAPRIRGAYVTAKPVAVHPARLPRLLGGSRPASARPGRRVVFENPSVAHVVGASWLTHRLAARETNDRLFGKGPHATDLAALPGGERGGWETFRSALPPSDVARWGDDGLERLFRRYGSRMVDVLAIARADPQLAQPIASGVEELGAEVVYAMREELAVYPGDFLSRRTPLRFSEEPAETLHDTVEEIMRRFSGSEPPALAAARERYLDARRRCAIREEVPGRSEEPPL